MSTFQAFALMLFPSTTIAANSIAYWCYRLAANYSATTKSSRRTAAAAASAMEEYKKLKDCKEVLRLLELKVCVVNV